MDVEIDIRVASNGRMVLPRAVRDALGMNGETKLLPTVENGTVRLSPISQGVLRAQELYAQHVRDDRGTDDFLRDRREEARHDERRTNEPGNGR